MRMVNSIALDMVAMHPEQMCRFKVVYCRISQLVTHTIQKHSTGVAHILQIKVFPIVNSTTKFISK